MKKHYLVRTPILLVAILMQISLFAQTFNGKLGYALSPIGHPYDYSQIGNFLQEVANTCNGGVVLANGNWRDNLSASGQIPLLQKTICNLQPSPYGYVDMPVYAWATYPSQLFLNSPTDATNNWSNSSMKDLFLQTLIRTADSLQPTYLFVGNEVNFYIEMDSLDYTNWSNFYSTAYDSVKAHSPNTKMGTVFNYDHLAGKGTNVGWMAPHWNALYNMDTAKMDIVGLTFYPFLEFATANSVPLTHLDPLFNKIGNIPLVITETGWPGDSLVGNWYATPQQQVDYVNKLFSMVNGRNVESINWLFLNYMMDTTYTPDIAVYKSISMRDSLGNDRPALPVWLSYCNSTDNAEFEKTRLVKIFPNPSTGNFLLKITGNDPELTFSVFNSVGQEILIETITLGIHEVKLAVPPGIYLYSVNNRNGAVERGKIIVE